MSNLDLFVVNVALPAIGHDFRDSPLSLLSWVLNGYAIAFAALLVPAGRIADRIGHRAGFLFGLGLFTVSSGLCAAAPQLGWLICARVLQAVGAAILVPTSLALLLAATPSERRAPIVRAWTAVAGAAAALGPMLGGLLTQLDWQWVFLINVPVGLCCLAVAPKVLPRMPGGRQQRLDLLGAALLALGIGALAYALVATGDHGWASVQFLGGLACTAVCIASFAWRSAGHPDPIVSMPMLRTGGFTPATLAATLFTVGFGITLLSVVLWCQRVLGYSALLTGLAVAPGPVMVPLLAFAVGPLAKVVGSTSRVAALGSVIFAVGNLWWFLAIDPSATSYVAQILPGMLLTGIGVGLALPALIGAAAAVLPAHRFATGSAVIQMARQIGSVVGVALLVSVLGGQQALGGTALPAFRVGWLVALVACGVAAVASLWPVRPQPEADGAAPVTEG